MYEQHYPAVLRYAARRVGAEAARDIVAETFLTAWRRLDRVPDGQPLPWLYATARKCLANEVRRQGTRERLDSRRRSRDIQLLPLDQTQRFLIVRAQRGRGSKLNSFYPEYWTCSGKSC
jgi:DNA-directed RNA polymerase specialized sigma24 family protein